MNGLHLLLLNYSVLSDLQIFIFSSVYTCICFFPNYFPFRLLQNVEQRSLLVICFKYSSMYMPVSNSLSIPPPHFPSVTKNSFSKSVSLFLTDIYIFSFIHQVYFMSAVCKAVDPNYSCLF